MPRNRLLLTLLLLPIAGLLIACGSSNDDDDGSTGDTAASGTTAVVESSVRTLVDAYNRQDLGAFLDGWTDNGIENEFQATRQEIEAVGNDFFGGPPLVLLGFTDTRVDGGEAETAAEFAFGRSIEKTRYDLIEQDGVWRIDGSAPLDVAIPDGTTTIDVDMEDFAFAFDASQITNGNIAFSAENTSEQPHELIILRVPEGFDLRQFLESQASDLPEGVELTGAMAPKDPGTTSTLVFTEPLPAGRYLMLCFLPDINDPQRTPHLLKGMESEFTVPAQGGNP